MRLFITALLTIVLSMSALASYTYVITDGMDFGGLSLWNHETLLMTGGGGYDLSLHEWSSAVIQETAPYNQHIYPAGGIEQLALSSYAHLDFSGGEVFEINMGNDSTVILSGGIIARLKTTQSAWRYDYTVDPPALVPNPHVEMIVKDWDYNTVTKILSGTWGNNSLFNIQLVNVTGYSPTIEDIKFTIIPEPASLFLLAMGGLLFKRR